MEEEGRNFMKAWLKVIASLCYSYFIASKFPKGLFRFFSLLPIFYLFTTLPLCVSRPIPSIILSGFFTWIANFKLILYSFNLGPLSTPYPQSSFLKFFFLSAFPIAIKASSYAEGLDVRSLTPDAQNTNNPEGSNVRSFTPNAQNTNNPEGSDVCSLTPDGQNTNNPNESDVRSLTPDDGTTNKPMVALNFWSKVMMFILLEVVYNNIKSMLIICCLMYLFIDILFGICDLVVKAILGVELELPSNEPYLSTSLQDFWGKRWNLMISNGLRDTIYKPIKSMGPKLVGPKWASLIGVMGCFVVSGLMHELIYYHVTRVRPTWEVTWFFVLQGVCVVVEMAVKRVVGRSWRLHWCVSGPLTVGFVMGTGFWLFFPQLMRNHVDVKATQDVLGFGKYIKETMLYCLSF